MIVIGSVFAAHKADGSAAFDLCYPLCGGSIPNYQFDGPPAPGYPEDRDVRGHMSSAGFLLVRRTVFRRIKWRWDLDLLLPDDPCFHRDCEEFRGVRTRVRHDLVARHPPVCRSPSARTGGTSFVSTSEGLGRPGSTGAAVAGSRAGAPGAAAAERAERLWPVDG